MNAGSLLARLKGVRRNGPAAPAHPDRSPALDAWTCAERWSTAPLTFAELLCYGDTP